MHTPFLSDATLCETKRESAFANGQTQIIPDCDEEGNFKALQCPPAGPCYCADPKKGTKLRRAMGRTEEQCAGEETKQT